MLIQRQLVVLRQTVLRALLWNILIAFLVWLLWPNYRAGHTYIDAYQITLIYFGGLQVGIWLFRAIGAPIFMRKEAERVGVSYDDYRRNVLILGIVSVEAIDGVRVRLTPEEYKIRVMAAEASRSIFGN